MKYLKEYREIDWSEDFEEEDLSGLEDKELNDFLVEHDSLDEYIHNCINYINKIESVSDLNELIKNKSKKNRRNLINMFAWKATDEGSQHWGELEEMWEERIGNEEGTADFGGYEGYDYDDDYGYDDDY